MLKKKWSLGSLLFLLLLVACQNGNLNLSQPVTEIEMITWDTEEYVASVQDETFIKDLVGKLENAETDSTGSIQFADPDYKLLFKHDEEVIYELGYHKEKMKLGIEGRYWEFDEIYGVTKKLPASID